MEQNDKNEINQTLQTEIKKKDASDQNSKFYETLFLGAMAGFGLLIGFSNGISIAKKSDEKHFNKGLMMLPDGPIDSKNSSMESGVRLAMRALGKGSIYAFAGVGLVSASIWFGIGAKDLKDFRQKVGEKLPRIPKNNPPQGRTEFESFREFFTYLAEESEKQKKVKEGGKSNS